VSKREFLHAQPSSNPHALAACSARHREWLRSIQPEFLVWIPWIVQPLLPREHSRQIPQFGLYFCGIGDSVRDFLAKELAVTFAKPVDGYFQRSF
jgi:hypothetical protein